MKRILILCLLLMGLAGCQPPDGDSSEISEARLEAEVEQLTNRLKALDRELEVQISAANSQQPSKSEGDDVSTNAVAELPESNWVISIERFEMAGSDFSGALESGDVSELRDRVSEWVEAGKATARSPIVGKVAAERSFNFRDVANLDSPTEFDVDSTGENPRFEPTEWARENPGTVVSGEIGRRDGNRVLLAIRIFETTQLEDETYPFPTLFENKDSGHLQLPVFHEAEVDTTMVVSPGKSEFVGNLIVPEKERGSVAARVQVLFVKVNEAK